MINKPDNFEIKFNTAEELDRTLRSLTAAVKYYYRDTSDISEYKVASSVVGILYASGITTFQMAATSQGVMTYERRFIEHYCARQTRYAGVVTSGKEAISFIDLTLQIACKNKTIVNQLLNEPYSPPTIKTKVVAASSKKSFSFIEFLILVTFILFFAAVFMNLN